MIPGGDHSTRSILHRRVSSWAEAVSVVHCSEQAATAEEEEEDHSVVSVSLENNEDGETNDLTQPLLLLPDLEYEQVAGVEDDGSISVAIRRRKGFRLWLVFIIMILSGVSTVVLAKLQSLPMYNYPTLLNMYANLMYIIVSFCYVIPVATFGWFHTSIPRRHLRVSKRPFLVMGFLDALSSAMQVLASVYLPGTLLVLLPQAAIPLSMVTSRWILREKFTKRQYVGAAVVVLGILVVLFPVLSHYGFLEYSCQAVGSSSNGDDDDAQNEYCAICELETSEEECLSHVVEEDTTTATTARDAFSIFTNTIIRNNNNNNNNNNTDSSDTDNRVTYCQWISRKESLRQDDLLVFVWSIVMVASCIPMVFSSVYKQVALQVELDPILLNGWVSLFQFLFGIPLAIPAGLVSSPTVKPWELPQNWYHGIQCLFVQSNFVGSGCHPDNCSEAALWVHLFLLSSIVFTVSMMFVLKYGGSASLLYLGLTLMVPLGHLVFSLHSPSSVGVFDILGLIVLVFGMILYRFGHNKNNNGPRVAPNASTSGGNGDPSASPGETGEGGANNEEKDGFLEFLREPFMLMGDI